MRVIALTGSVAAGKSTVAALFRSWGATIIDVDGLVREVQQPGGDALAAMVTRFGSQILDARGALDRAAMRQLMLADPKNRHDLEAIIHPAVEQRRQALLREAAERGDPLVVVDIPLLFETGTEASYAGIVVVDAPEAERRRRLIEERGLSGSEADLLLSTQWSPARKRAAATWVIENGGDRTLLETQARAVWQAMVG